MRAGHVTVDFKDSFLSVANERVTEQLRCTMRIHNRSDRWIKGLSIEVGVASIQGGVGTGFKGEPGHWVGLAPGQEVEVKGCGGRGNGGAPGNHVRILCSSVESTQLKRLRKGRFPFRWTLEYLENSQSREESSTGLLVCPFWRRTTTEYLQNEAPFEA